MSHGLSGTGLEYDGNGNHILWWPSEMIHEYLKKAKCFVDQFNNYNVSGTQTLSENIADTAGLVAAYRAYRKKMKKGRKGQSLPGLETLDSNKLFFISFSMTFCHTATSQISALDETDTHSKRSVRVNGAVANVEGFNEAFKCNNVEKCTLWN
ncbi:endothelin-converting enzyme homolog [Leptopilina heterotoma]|uniref:endothelin-converting enzyme homolog n=1 Tax=Leptopilina heterotoma TaxID=63436 RepID=UPI001CA7E3CA|nr:endothelin-converting enzyme homolog [Leptopilina heterotoma]